VAHQSIASPRCCSSSSIHATVINERFAEIRADAGLDELLTPHCLRHSYVTHLAELGWAPKFIQDQVGHSHAATTAAYMSVGDDFKDRLVRAAIDEQLIQLGGPSQ
jgi:integrase/recombinase XerC